MLSLRQVEADQAYIGLLGLSLAGTGDRPGVKTNSELESNKGGDSAQSKKRASIKEEETREQLEDDNDTRRNRVWNIINEEYIPGTTRSIGEWFKAVQVCF